MNIYTLSALVIAWFASGFFSFVYWWTKEHDLTSAEMPVACYTAILVGPFNFFVGWFMTRSAEEDSKVLFKKRK